MIEVNNLTFAYKNNLVLDEISFQCPEGALIAVLGPNGAGKSTLFKCLLGFLKNYKGKITIHGEDIRKLNRKRMASYVAYIPQSEAVLFNYTALDTVLMGTTGMLSPLSAPGPEQKAMALEAMDYLGITHLADRGINELSGGEQQMILLARAMAQQAKILIMDEPTANLDYGNQQLVLNCVKRMAKNGYTILLSTHNPEHALQYATHVLAIKDQRILSEGRADEKLNEQLIQEIYGLKVKITEVLVNGGRVRSCVPDTAAGRLPE